MATPSSSKSSALTPRKYWQKQFGGFETEKDETHAVREKAQKSEPAGEEETNKPRRIEELGEEAYWVGTPITGALYVLEGDKFVRISVGGIGEESVRIEKSKILARAALKRL